MEQCTGDPLVATETTPHPRALWSVTLVTDAQALSMDYRPYAQMAPQIARLVDAEAGLAVRESELPEIRSLATLSAAWRLDAAAGRSPANFTDDADWLAARAFLLGLSHVEVTLERVALFDLACQRLQRLCQRAGLARQTLMPVFCGAHGKTSSLTVLRGWSGEAPAGRLREQCRARFEQLLVAMARRRQS